MNRFSKSQIISYGVLIIAFVLGGIIFVTNSPRTPGGQVPAGAMLSTLDASLQRKTFTDSYQKEAYEKALAYEEKITKEPDGYELYTAAGFWWKSLGEYTKDNAYYGRAAEIYMAAGRRFEHLTVYQPYVNAASVYVTLGEYGRAEDALKGGISVAPEVAELYIKLADLYESHMKKAPEETIAVYEDGLSRTSYQPYELYPAYGAYLRRLGQKEAALKAFEAAAKYVHTGFVEQSIKELKSELGMK